MKLTIFCVLSITALGLAVDIDMPTSQGSSPDGWFVPTGDGKFEYFPREIMESRALEIEPRAVTVKFFLFTRNDRNNGRLVNLGDLNGLNAAGFNKAYPTRFIAHGWQNNYQSDVNRDVRNAFFDVGNYNVFCVDWSSAAESINYLGARYSVAEVGGVVASFVDFLNEKAGVSFSSVNLIGHSLGAHVSGYAGKQVKRGKIPKIFGLDPALPLFDFNNCGTRLCSTDATYVESIQTNGGLLGFLEPIGKAAFYPNGGKTQPGCGIDASGSCAHGRSYQYLAESIRKNSFASMKCSDYKTAVANNCGSTYSSVRMGSQSNTGISGAYYVPVKSASPFGMA